MRPPSKPPWAPSSLKYSTCTSVQVFLNILPATVHNEALRGHGWMKWPPGFEKRPQPPTWEASIQFQTDPNCPKLCSPLDQRPMDYTHVSFIVQADCYRSPNLGLFTGSDFCSHQGLGWHVTFTCKLSKNLLFRMSVTWEVGRSISLVNLLPPPSVLPPPGQQRTWGQKGKSAKGVQYFKHSKKWVDQVFCILIVYS